MSVLLTASKKAVKTPKSAKHKVKKAPAKPQPNNQRQFDPTPPLSSARTSVWHWELDGEPTTVMLRKDNSQVWCNGEVIETVTNFPEGDTGGVIDFIIINSLGKCYDARIRREADQGKLAYHLYVKGFMILEHTSVASVTRSSSLQGQSSTEEAPFADGPPPIEYMDPINPAESYMRNDVPHSFLPPPPYYEDPLLADKKND